MAWKGYAAVAAAKVALESLAALDRGRVRALRHPLQRDPGRRHRHARRCGDPGQRAAEGAGAAPQPVRPPHHARRRRQRDLPALPRRGGLDQRRRDPRRRRRARLGVAPRDALPARPRPLPPRERDHATASSRSSTSARTTPGSSSASGSARGARVLPLDYIRATRNRDVRAAREAALYDNAEIGRRAAEMALARAGHRPRRDIGLVISRQLAPDIATPAEACTIAAALGIEVPAFDVNSACTSFLAQLRPALDDATRPRCRAYVLLVVHGGADPHGRLRGPLDGGAVRRRQPPRPSSRRACRAARASSTRRSSRARRPRQGVDPAPRRTSARTGARCRCSRSSKTARVLRAPARALRGEDERALHFVGHQANLRDARDGLRARAASTAERHHTNVELLRQHRRRRARSASSPQRWDEVGRRGRRRASSASAPASPGRASCCASRPRREVRRVPRARPLRAPTSCWPSPTGALVEDAPPSFDLAAPGAADADGRPHRRRSAARGARAASWPSATCASTTGSSSATSSSDPVQPGCLGVDGVWQLLGFFCAWAGGLGSGRALGCGEIEFFGQIRPHDRLVRYEIDVRRYSELPAVGLRDRDRRRDGARRRRADLHDQARQVGPLPRHRLRRLSRTPGPHARAGGSCRERRARSPS